MNNKILDNLTDPDLSNAIVVDVFDWSIRKVRIKGPIENIYVLIGNAFSYNKFEILQIKRFYTKPRLIAVEGADEFYSLCGQSGLVAEAEVFWCEYKIMAGIIFDLDITHKYLKP
jgi:hypothetical protein